MAEAGASGADAADAGADEGSTHVEAAASDAAPAPPPNAPLAEMLPLADADSLAQAGDEGARARAGSRGPTVRGRAIAGC